jgi:hypothetical protein
MRPCRRAIEEGVQWSHYSRVAGDARRQRREIGWHWQAKSASANCHGGDHPTRVFFGLDAMRGDDLRHWRHWQTSLASATLRLRLRRRKNAPPEGGG